jgi:phenylalanyl-tRNA synthetase beta chain
MKFPLSWLREWVELPSDPREVGQLLMNVGVGLEALENRGAQLFNVVVARVMKRQAHPNADKLSLCEVNDGSQILQIVCGAKNFKEGDLVPLAREGAELPGGFKIKRSKIRGQESFGMLCSSEELGLGKAGDGLLILDSSLKEGLPLAEALGLDDPIFEVETTANRPDHLSIRGLAREIAALSQKKFKEPSISVSEGGDPAVTSMRASVADTAACPLYMGRILRNLTVGPSPDWMKRRLEGAGIRSINNVVDVTNYVLVEYGQPLHAFDLKKIEGGLVEARFAKPGESLRTLDGTLRSLEPGDLVIADAKKPLAVAGVMGGADSEVTGASTEVLLEGAVFRVLQVRRTSRRLGLRSESSLRFERGVDPAATAEALNRALSLMIQLAGGQAAPGSLSVGPGMAPHAEINGSVGRINALLGGSHSPETMAELLGRRGFKASVSGDALKVLAPSWRPDVSCEADLAEEVAHLAGLDKVAGTDLADVRSPDADAWEWTNSWILRRHLASFGLTEAFSPSTLDPALAGLWNMGEALKIDNPLSEEMSLMRPLLLPNLVASALESLRHQAPGLALYELGRVFPEAGESASLALVLAGQPSEGNWAVQAKPYDFFDLRGVAEGLGQALGYALRVHTEAQPPSWLHPGQAARIQLGPMSGWMGALHPALARKLDARHGIFVMELEGWEAEGLSRLKRFQAFSLLPHVERDLSCLVDHSFEAGRLLEAIRKEGFGGQQLRLKDVFQGAPLPQGKKSLTVSLIYLPAEATLTDEDVNKRHAELSSKLKAALPLEIRD